MDSFDLVSSFATAQSFTVTRTPKGGWARGRSAPAPPSSLTIIGAVQPAMGRDLLRLPEERRARETRVLFTTTEMFVGGQDAAFEADRVAIDGGTWEVQQVERFSDSMPPNDPSLFKCIVQVTQ